MHNQIPKWVYYAALCFVVVFWGVSSVLYTYFYKYYSAAILTGIMTFFSAVFFLPGTRLVQSVAVWQSGLQVAR